MQRGVSSRGFSDNRDAVLRAAGGPQRRARGNTMAKPKVTATDQLSNVIEVVELGQRTGMLLVERGSGSVLEEGEIYFIGGRAVHASLAGLRGRDALAALSRWGACRFAFDREAPRPEVNLTNPSQPALPSLGPQSPVPNARPSWPSLTGSQPGYSAPNLPHPAESSGAWSVPQAVRSSASLSNDNDLTARSYGAPPAPPAPASTPPSASLTPQYYPSPQAVQAPGRDPLQRRPRRAPDVRDLMVVVTTHNLSRSHRTILLLADGEHTVMDLARLSSKPVDEVRGLLDELEGRGLVYYYT